MRVSIVGSGYVGLVTGACFARFGCTVVCMDRDEARVRTLSGGEVPFYEPQLPELVRTNVDSDRLSFTTDLAAAVEHAEVVFIAVGTPPSEDGSADVSAVIEVAEQVAKFATRPLFLAVKSTVPVGTGDRVQAACDAVTGERRVEVVSNPEFLKEGNAVTDFLKPARVVVGTLDEGAREFFADLYGPLMRVRERLLFMDRRSAEITKYAANGLLATKVSFINELARLCDAVGADVTSVRFGMGSDPRIGPHFLFPGVGYGGSCFPKDIDALVHTAQEHGCALSILEAVQEVNAGQKRLLVDKVVDRFGEDLTGRRFALWGLSFKPETDDMRQAPSLTIIEGLLARGATVVAHDPAALDSAKRELGDRIGYAPDAYSACDGADALLVVTEWSSYRNPDFEEVKARLAQPVVFDGRNLYRPERLRRAGVEHYAIGRGLVAQV